MSKSFNDIPGKINITKVPLNEVKESTLNKDCQWVKVLLMEMNEKATNKSPEAYLQNSSLDIAIKMQKKFSSNYGEYLLFNIKLEADFFTECVKSLEEMKDSIELEVKCAFIDQAHADDPEAADQTDIYLDNDMYELYYYENRTVDLAEMIHEQVYLNMNQYPTLEQDTDVPPKSPKDSLH